MNKKGVGLGPAIAMAVILLAVFLVGTNSLLNYGKGNAIRVAKINADRLEVGELLLDLLKLKVDDLNVADLIGLKEFNKIENVVKEKLVDVGFSFRVYNSDFKNVLQSEALYVLENSKDSKEIVVVQKIENYFGEELYVYLAIKNE